jgi:hypothetical protein
VIDKGPPLPPDVQAILEQERPIPALTPAVRARALAAARAAVAASAVPPPARLPSPWARWAAVAALTFAAGVAVGAVAYRTHRDVPRPADVPAPVTPVAAVPAPAAAAVPSPELAVPPPDSDAPAAEDAKRKLVVPQEELRLLRQARAAVARDDFAAALPPIAEHTRRFKDGRLAEEREALRVKALAGLGRRGEARRAAAAFQTRFPRSVLLPAVRRISPGGE